MAVAASCVCVGAIQGEARNLMVKAFLGAPWPTDEIVVTAAVFDVAVPAISLELCTMQPLVALTLGADVCMTIRTEIVHGATTPCTAAVTQRAFTVRVELFVDFGEVARGKQLGLGGTDGTEGQYPGKKSKTHGDSLAEESEEPEVQGHCDVHDNRNYHD